MSTPEPEFDLSQLRAHVRELHPTMVRKGLARANKDLAWQHGREHHHLHCSHLHEEDNAGKLIGPGSDRRRPSGWMTGLKVIMRKSR